MKIDLLYLSARGFGWGPIDELVQLMARLLEARVTVIPDRGEVSVWRKSASLLPRRRRRGTALLVIATNPAQLAYAARTHHWWPGYETIGAWVIDSFWTDRISRFARGGHHFDHIFITDESLIDEWSEMTSTRTHWAPWGADTLVFPISGGPRPTDLLRLGRQPEAWDDDSVTMELAGKLGLAMSGSPPSSSEGLRNQELLRTALLRSKCVLAFHNGASPGDYTHPTRTYVTGRWMNALAAGAIVVGATPPAAESQFWPGATQEISPQDRVQGLHTVRDVVASWTPAWALENQVRARATLDWRLRIRGIVQAMGLSEPRLLSEEISQLGQTDLLAPTADQLLRERRHPDSDA
ncbi:MAG: hypothetical protein ABWX92_00375 [Mycetocola sp.]